MNPEQLPPIAASVFVATTPENLYRILTTGAGWDAWFTQGTEVVPEVGGHIKLRWPNQGFDKVTIEDGGAVLIAEPPNAFAFEWFATEHATKVSFQIDSHGHGSRLCLEETGYRNTCEDLKAYVDCAVGWGEALIMLKFYVEFGVTYGPIP